MGRKIEQCPIPMAGRDKGKVFILTEMPASKGEKWAMRALLALARSGADIGEGYQSGGMAAIAVLGFQALSKLEFKEAEELLDEMFQCVTYQPDPQKHPEVIRALVEDDIEEVATRIYLRMRLFTLHTGFSFADAEQKLKTGLSATAQPSQTTQTSPAPSGQ